MNTFVVPPLHGPTTGGTRYNRGLLDALERLGERPEQLSLEQARRAVGEPRTRTMWIDSLWLEELPGLARRASARWRIGLLTRALPTLFPRSSHATATVERSLVTPILRRPR